MNHIILTPPHTMRAGWELQRWKGTCTQTLAQYQRISVLDIHPPLARPQYRIHHGVYQQLKPPETPPPLEPPRSCKTEAPNFGGQPPIHPEHQTAYPVLLTTAQQLAWEWFACHQHSISMVKVREKKKKSDLDPVSTHHIKSKKESHLIRCKRKYTKPSANILKQRSVDICNQSSLSPFNTHSSNSVLHTNWNTHFCNKDNRIHSKTKPQQRLL